MERRARQSARTLRMMFVYRPATRSLSANGAVDDETDGIRVHMQVLIQRRLHDGYVRLPVCAAFPDRCCYRHR